MSQAWQRDRLAEFCSDARISEAGTYFLQSVVRLADPSGVLEDNALSTRTASFTVPWAASTLEACKDGYLREWHARNALESALKACDNLQSLYHLLPTAAAWHAQLSSTLGEPSLQVSHPMNIKPSEVAMHQREVASLMLAQDPSPSPALGLVKLLAGEVAISLISRNADLDHFVWELQRLRPTRPL